MWYNYIGQELTMDQKACKKPQNKKSKTRWTNRLKDMYRWKFLRLNEKYILDFKRWKSISEKGEFLEGTEGFTINITNIRGQEPHTEVIDEALKKTNITSEKLDDCKNYICRNWGISKIVDPKISNLPSDVFFFVNKLKPIIYEGNINFGIKKHSQVIDERIKQILSYSTHYYPSPFKIIVLDLRKCELKDIDLAKYKKEFCAGQKSIEEYLSDDLKNNPDPKTMGIKVSWSFEEDENTKNNLRQRNTLSKDLLDRTLAIYAEYQQMKQENNLSDKAIYSKLALMKEKLYKTEKNNPKDDPRAFIKQAKEDIARAKFLIKTAPFIMF